MAGAVNGEVKKGRTGYGKDVKKDCKPHTANGLLKLRAMGDGARGLVAQVDSAWG